MIEVPVFDVEALRQWDETPLPEDRSEWPRLVNQIRTDCVGAADHIDLLTLALAEARTVAS